MGEGDNVQWRYTRSSLRSRRPILSQNTEDQMICVSKNQNIDIATGGTASHIGRFREHYPSSALPQFRIKHLGLSVLMCSHILVERQDSRAVMRDRSSLNDIAKSRHCTCGDSHMFELISVVVNRGLSCVEMLALPDIASESTRLPLNGDALQSPRLWPLTKGARLTLERKRRL
jgi:hypothetical protein